MDQEIKDQAKELLEDIQSYETDFKEHCKMTLEFMRYNNTIFDSELIVDAIQTSFARVTDGESFFDEFDFKGLGESLESSIKYEIEQTNLMIDQADSIQENKKLQKKLKRLERQQKEYLKMKLKDYHEN